MIIDFTKQKDKYISDYIAEVTGDTVIDAKEKIESKDKSPLFSERPYVLVGDYSMVVNFKTLVTMGRGRFEGSKIFYCVFVTEENSKKDVLSMAKNISAVKNMVLFGCDSFARSKSEPSRDNIIKARMIGSSIRDCVPLYSTNACFPMRVAPVKG